MGKQKPSRPTMRAGQQSEDKLWQFTVKSWAVTAGVLRTRRDPHTVLALLDFFDWLGDQNMSAIRQTLPSLACRAGCAFCCYIGADRPDLLPVEALRIVAYLELHVEIQQMVQERLSGPTADIQRADKAACLFLQQDHCLIYPVRPMRCRAQTSPDATLCEQNYLGRRETMPLLKEPAMLYHSISTGLRMGLRDAGLQDAPLRLSPTIRLAIDAPQVWECWLSGEKLENSILYPETPEERAAITRFMRQNRVHLTAEQQTMHRIIDICLNPSRNP